ncbi:MAG: carboxypeptidase-like regulatory domain-containing protein, partial [Flavobacterium sp.]
MKQAITLLVLFFSALLHAQTAISGSVTDAKGNPAIAANVYIEGTYHGATTDENGNFTFTTDAAGTQVLVVTFLGFDDFK